MTSITQQTENSAARGNCRAVFVAQWKSSHPLGRVITCHLSSTAIPPISAEWIGAVYTLEEARTPQQKEQLTEGKMRLARS